MFRSLSMQKNTNFVYREQVVLQKSICKQMCGIQNTFSHHNNVIMVLTPGLVHEPYLAVSENYYPTPAFCEWHSWSK